MGVTWCAGSEPKLGEESIHWMGRGHSMWHQICTGGGGHLQENGTVAEWETAHTQGIEQISKHVKHDETGFLRKGHYKYSTGEN